MLQPVNVIRFTPSPRNLFQNAMHLVYTDPAKVHFPQDSCLLKSVKNLAVSTRQLSSSMTMTPPEPMMAPASCSESKSIGVSSRLSGRQPPEGPPICTALNSLPLRTPPPIS